MLTERQQRAAAEVARQTGIDAAMIHRLVHTFYGKVRQDEVLAPVFAARISDWEPHLTLLPPGQPFRRADFLIGWA
jgi:hemoglobin